MPSSAVHVTKVSPSMLTSGSYCSPTPALHSKFPSCSPLPTSPCCHWSCKGPLINNVETILSFSKNFDLISKVSPSMLTSGSYCSPPALHSKFPSPLPLPTSPCCHWSCCYHKGPLINYVETILNCSKNFNFHQLVSIEGETSVTWTADDGMITCPACLPPQQIPFLFTTANQSMLPLKLLLLLLPQRTIDKLRWN